MMIKWWWSTSRCKSYSSPILVIRRYESRRKMQKLGLFRG